MDIIKLNKDLAKADSSTEARNDAYRSQLLALKL
jgi:hypothetical protein